MGDGYGSECHLLRFLGRHRRLLDREVMDAVGATDVRWHDYPFDASTPWLDSEHKGMGFINDESIQAAWKQTWPSSGNSQNWDAVGQVLIGGSWEWLLVEAKANLEEIRSSCQAKENGGLPLILRTLSAAKADLGVPAHKDWLNRYYQFCNRVAALHFLGTRGVRARLLFIYFIGDRGGNGRTCPIDESGWSEALRAQDDHVGLPPGHALSGRISKMFLAVSPAVLG